MKSTLKWIGATLLLTTLTTILIILLICTFADKVNGQQSYNITSYSIIDCDRYGQSSASPTQKDIRECTGTIKIYRDSLYLTTTHFDYEFAIVNIKSSYNQSQYILSNYHNKRYIIVIAINKAFLSSEYDVGNNKLITFNIQQ
jgi:hypothetical protein